MRDGGQAVGDDQRGAAARGEVDLGLNGFFGARVERRGGFVEDQDGRILEQRAGDGDALFFTAREFQAAFANTRFVAVGQATDEVGELGGGRGGVDQAVGGLGATVLDVVAQAVVEKHGVLRHDADGLAQAVLLQVADVGAIDGDAPAGDVVEAEQQPAEGGFARAGMPDHGDGLAGRDLEVHVEQDLSRRIVGEADLFETHRGVVGGEAAGVGLVGDFARLVEQAEHALDVGEGLADFAIDHAEEVERDVELQHVGIDQHDVADRHAAVDHADGGLPQHAGDGDGNDCRLADVQPRQGELILDLGIGPLTHLLVVAAGFEFFVVEVFHRLEVEQAVDRARVGGRVELVGLASQGGAPVGDLDGKSDV